MLNNGKQCTISERSSKELHSGYLLAQWEIQQVIGEGGFSFVYQAIDHQRNIEVAIKEYFPTSIAMRNSLMQVVPRNEFLLPKFNTGLEYFHQEAEILKNIEHSNVPKLFDFFQENNTAYIITTCHKGINLKQWYKDNSYRISQDWLIKFLISLLDIVSAVHKNSYLHLDISWDNILIQGEDNPVLLDFGSACSMAPCSMTQCNEVKTLILKPGFSPPELYYQSGRNILGPWSDIYSIGALIYALITGELPPISLVRCIEDQYKPLIELGIKGYSSKFLMLIDNALSTHHDLRPQTIEKLIEQVKLF